MPKKGLSRTAPTAKPRKTKEDARRTFGRARSEALFPAPAPKADLPRDYSEALRELKERIQQARLRTVLAANAAMIQLYWDLGQTILDRQAREGWGTKVIDRLSHDLRQEFPVMAGLSPRNLKYMRAFAAAWPDLKLVQRVVAQIPWRQNIALLERLDERDHRIWYAQQTAHYLALLDVPVGCKPYEVSGRRGRAGAFMRASMVQRSLRASRLSGAAGAAAR